MSAKRNDRGASLTISYRPAAELVPYARNARTHHDAQIAKIAASIVEYGWTNPILVDGDNGIIAGHGRLAAARKLGLDQVPVIVLGHLTPAQKRAYVIADNAIALNGEWDVDLLKLELAELADSGFDVDTLGVSGDWMADGDEAAPQAHGDADDDADEVVDVPADSGRAGLDYPVVLQFDKAGYERWKKVRKELGSLGQADTALLLIERAGLA